MRKFRSRRLFLGGFAALLATCSWCQNSIAFRIVDPQVEQISFHWKNDSDQVIGSIGALRDHLTCSNKELLFAMNGGMYTKEQGPVGLYIEGGRIIHRIDRRPEGRGNFYMQPNGVFGLSADGKSFVMPSSSLENMLDVQYATQSGPMLLIDGAIHSSFTLGSKNLNIRNGVGILPDGRVIFGISRDPINFYDFATWFKEHGCENALYLDGSVSKAFIPEQELTQTDGMLGVLIAVTCP